MNLGKLSLLRFTFFCYGISNSGDLQATAQLYNCMILLYSTLIDVTAYDLFSSSWFAYHINTVSIILIRGVWLRRVISWACGEWLPGPPNSPEEKKGHLWVFKALKETFRVSKPDEGKCSRLALGLFLVQATGTKSNKLSGLNNKAYISCSYGNWKSKIKVLVDLIPGEILFLAYQVAPSYTVLFGRDRG